MGCLSTLAVVIATLGSQSVENVVNDQVDLIEVNHFYDDQGRLVFDQVIFYDWDPARGRYDVRAWRLLKKPTQMPQRDVRGRKFFATWHDGEVLRHVEAEAMRESWTQYDPELVEREFLPKDKRRELRKLTFKIKK